jgi:glycosyltransferase involved in cell wall biosynthesis
VLTSRGSSLDEVADGAALAVDPLDVDALARGLRQLLGDDELRARLRKLGLARAEVLSWRRTAEGTRAVFQALAEGRLPHPEAT